MIYYCVKSCIDDKGRMTAAITATKEADEMPINTEYSTNRKDIYNDWFDSLEAAEAWIDEIKKEG